MDAVPPPSRTISSGGRPPRPAMAPPDANRVPRRRAFIVLHPRPTAPPPDAGLPHRQESPPPNAGLPHRQERPPPDANLRRRQEGPPGVGGGVVPPSGGLPRQLPNGPPPLGGRAFNFTEPDAATWDAGNTASSQADVYEAAGDDFSPNPIVHWMSDYSEPRASSSQSFTALMTQEADGDLELLMQPDATPSSGGKGASKDFESDRTPNSLEHRCGIILKECMKFQGYYEEVERRHPSGVPYQEHLLEAQARYARKAKGKNCQFISCWLKLRHTEKFASLEGNKRPPNSRELNLSVGSQQEDEGRQDEQETSSIPPVKKARPPGRKQSKEKLKKNEGDDEYKDMMQTLMVMKTEEHKMKKERWDRDMMLEQRKLEMEERRLQWEQEQKIMFCDVTTMDSDQRAYVLAKRAEIAKRAAASVCESGGASVGESGESAV